MSKKGILVRLNTSKEISSKLQKYGLIYVAEYVHGQEVYHLVDDKSFLRCAEKEMNYIDKSWKKFKKKLGF